MSAVLARVSAGDPDLEAVDPRIEPLLYAALSPDPAERPHHDEVVAALERYAHGAPVTEAIQVRRVRPETQRLAVPPTTALPLPAARRRLRRRGPRCAPVVGAAVRPRAGLACPARPGTPVRRRLAGLPGIDAVARSGAVRRYRPRW